jgi:peptidoglycan/xylan/chitin deacetylase (PgdA/CDA1 family)
MKKIIILFFIMFYPLQSFSDEPGIISLMYHRVGEGKYPSTNVSTEMFKQHLQAIETSGLTFIEPGQFKNQILEGKPFSKRYILLTVDDAFKSFYENAWPVLKEKKIPFILFVNTREITSKHPNYMSWDQIRELKNSGLVTIGGHSWSHEYFINMKLEEVKKDIQKSHDDYQKQLKQIPDLYAHTFGETSSDIIKLIRDFNYKIIFGQHSGVISRNENINYLPRFSLNENYGKLKRFQNILKSRAFNIKSYEPKTILLNQTNNPTNMKLSFDENVKGINCFDNSGGDWKNTKINFISNNQIELIFDEPFKKRRGRLNCTMPSKEGLIKWFGYQYSVVN